MTPAEVETDAEDIEALKRGDDRALDRLMNRWQIPLRSFLYRFTQNEHDALDLAQETFVRIYRNRAQFRTGARFSTWMFTIACNLARDRARSQRRRATQSLEESPEPIDGRQPGSAAETEERAQAVRTAIAELPDDLRAAVILFEYEEKSHAEIAEIVHTSPKAVETRLYRARQQLKKTLARYLKI